MAADISWIKKEPGEPVSTAVVPEGLDSAAGKATDVTVARQQVSEHSDRSYNTSSNSTNRVKTETSPAVEAGKNDNSTNPPGTQNVSLKPATIESQPSQVVPVALLNISPKYHEPAKNMTASQVLMKNRIRRKKALSSNTVIIRKLLPKTTVENDTCVPKIQTVYYTSKSNASNPIGEIKIADNAVQMSSATSESSHSKHHTTVHNPLGGISGSATKNSQPAVAVSVAQSQQITHETLKLSQGLQSVPQCIPPVPATPALFPASLGLTQAQSLLPTTQNLFQNQPAILQSSRNLIQHFVPQNMILLNQGNLQNSMILNNRTQPKFMKIVATPQSVSGQPSVSGISLLQTGSASIQLPASTAVRTVSCSGISQSFGSGSSVVTGDKSRGSGLVSSVTSLVPSIVTETKPVLGSHPASSPQMIGNVGLYQSSQQTQTVIPNATRYVWLPGSGLGSNLTRMQTPVSTSLLATGTGLSEGVGEIKSVSSAPQKAGHGGVKTDLQSGQEQTASKVITAPVSGRNVPASAVKQDNGSTVVLLPPVLSQGYRLGGIRIENVTKKQNTTDVNRPSQTGLVTEKSETQNKNAKQKTCVLSGQTLFTAENKNMLPQNQKTEKTTLKIVPSTVKTLIPKSYIMYTEANRSPESGTGEDEESKSSVTIKVDNRLHRIDNTSTAAVVVLSEFKVSHIATLLLKGSIHGKPSPVILDDGRPFLPMTYTGPYIPKGIQEGRHAGDQEEGNMADTEGKTKVAVDQRGGHVADDVLKDKIASIKKEKEETGDVAEKSEEKNACTRIKENSDIERYEESLSSGVGMTEKCDMIEKSEETAGASVGGLKDNASTNKRIQTIDVLGKVVWLFLDFDGPKLLWKYGKKDGTVFAVPLDEDLPSEVLDEISEILQKFKLTFHGSINPIYGKYAVGDKGARQVGKRSLAEDPSDQKLRAATAKNSHGPILQAARGIPEVQKQKGTRHLLVKENNDVVQRALMATVRLERIPLTDALRKQLEVQHKRRLPLDGCDKERPVKMGRYTLDTTKTGKLEKKKITEQSGQFFEPHKPAVGKTLTAKSDNIKSGKDPQNVLPDVKSRKRSLISDDPVKSMPDGSISGNSDTGVRKSGRLGCKPKTNYIHLQEGLGFMDDEEQTLELNEPHTSPRMRKKMGGKPVPQSKSGTMGGKPVPQPKSGTGIVRGLHSSKIISGFDVYIDKADSTDREDENLADSDRIVKTEIDENIDTRTALFLKMHSKDFTEVILTKKPDPELGLHRNVFYVCAICGSFQCHLEDELETHLKQHYSGELTCKTCHFHVACKQELLEHQALEHTGRPLYNCQMCKTPFFSQAVYQKHIKRHESKTACKACKLSFPSEILYRSHMEKNHHKKIHCHLCSLLFKTEDKVRAHYKQCVSGYQCCMCYVKEKTLYVLRLHMEKEHDHRDELHVCRFENCGASFLTPAGLGTHTSSHLGELY